MAASSSANNRLTSFCFVTDHDNEKQIVSLNLECIQGEYQLHVVCMDSTASRILKTTIDLKPIASNVTTSDYLEIKSNPEAFICAIQDSMAKEKTKLDSLLRTIHLDVPKPQLQGKHKLLAVDRTENSSHIQKLLASMVNKISWLEKSTQQAKDGHVETSRTAHLVPIQRLKTVKPRKIRYRKSYSLINPTVRKVKREGITFSSESD